MIEDTLWNCRKDRLQVTWIKFLSRMAMTESLMSYVLDTL